MNNVASCELVDVSNLRPQQIMKLQDEAAVKGLYWDENYRYKYFPRITAMPYISFEKARVFEYRSKYTFDVKTGVKVAPKSANIRKIINYPYKRMGAPQVCIKGEYGSGKSNLLNLIMALQVAKGIRMLTFNDRRFEVRSLAAHGWFDKKTDEFHPFLIDVWVPKDYEFRVSNPIWNTYWNVNKREYSDVDEIFQSMEKYHITCVYEECFTDAGRLQLWLDLVDRMAENIDSKIVYSFTHHELSRLIPEVPTKELHKLVRLASNALANFRKDKIGLLATFHMSSEVFYRIAQKFTYEIHKRPTNRQYLQKVEKDAKKISLNQCNVSRGGYWMQHTIEYYPELPDMFRLVPQREKLNYPSLSVDSEKKSLSIKKEFGFEEIDLIIMNLRSQGMSYKEIGQAVDMRKTTVFDRYKKLSGILAKKQPDSFEPIIPV